MKLRKKGVNPFSVDRTNLPFPDTIAKPKPKKKPKSPNNEVLLEKVAELKESAPANLGRMIDSTRDFLLSKQALQLVAFGQATIDSKEILEAVLGDTVNLNVISEPLTAIAQEAVALQLIQHVSDSLSLTDKETRMLYYIHLSKAVGSKGPPSEKLLLELLQGLAVPRSQERPEVPVRKVHADPPEQHTRHARRGARTRK